MSVSKPWYMSKTIWASIVTVLLSIGGLLGFKTGAIDSNATAEMILQAITAVSGLLAILGRLSAEEKIS